ncbi:histone deacetylase family protein [Zavarzinella formosa]|uniref:histone deacetylase family protein n=1 Tax=Zavarzinella formosa TaxID=360055 RepID=UPI0002E69272|nr:histone deacetylase [Zavarzinella formosa]
MAAVVYNRRYDIGFLGLERLHPFDSRKYGRAWRELNRLVGRDLRRYHIPVDRGVSDEELLLAHSPEYLARMSQSKNIVAALEIPSLRRAPAFLLRWNVLRPMRWAARGTVLAAQAAISCGAAVNLSGGYHHAKRDAGEGFCIFSDIAVAIRQLRAEGRIKSGQRIAYVDLDAHQGNGVCHQFRDDRDVFIFDMHNPSIYPCRDVEARQRIDCDLPLPVDCGGREYLGLLRKHLPGFLDSISRSGTVALGIFNAGTDVIQGDPLGAIALSAEDILERDLYTFGEFRKRRIPMVMLTSGGYTRESYRLIAASVCELLRQDGTVSG